jgi:hypothetical protein
MVILVTQSGCIPDNRRVRRSSQSKYPTALFKCRSDLPEITSYLLQSMTLGKLHGGSSLLSIDRSSTEVIFCDCPQLIGHSPKMMTL